MSAKPQPGSEFPDLWQGPLTVTPRTFGWLSRRSGMKTDVWPWKGVLASIKAKSTPRERP